MPIERNEHANVRVWNISPNDVKWERRIYCSSTKLQMTTFHSLEFEFCLLSHDLRNLHLLLFWKSFDFTFKFTSIHEKFKMQIPMRTSSNFFLRNTNIHKSMSIYRNIITGVGDRGYVIWTLIAAGTVFTCKIMTKPDGQTKISTSIL